MWMCVDVVDAVFIKEREGGEREKRERGGGK